ncbi:MAG TPA: UdgX family uracil-DNA binding protein [Kofleriaceae bacterium]|nr:UdgX family uracil-DNA binding protein [Kofleriaceae bacterium]
MTYAEWRDRARVLLANNVQPHEATFTPSLFEAPLTAPPSTLRVPRRFVALAEDAILHRERPDALLYRALWRLMHGEPALVEDAADPDIRALSVMAGAVKRDLHKMHAFVRFRLVSEHGDDHYVAWYAPDHQIVERAAPFFAERFAAMRWTILTPERSVAWDGNELQFFAGVPRHAAPAADELEDLWRTYYASIFNPARANPRVMRQHMPARYWAAMPETALISDLLAAAAPRVETMTTHVTGKPLPVLRDEARHCSACELCGPATQTVFGEGPVDARIVLVGEQPGDQEDLAGRPFVGPAGAVLDAALARAGIARDTLYVTNAVKHFRFLPRGKKRLHQRPTADQVRAYKPWLAAELAAIQPRVIVCLGATAALSLIGSRFSITRDRGRVVQTSWAETLLATHHPAAILRVDPADRPRYEKELAEDLRTAVLRGSFPSLATGVAP